VGFSFCGKTHKESRELKNRKLEDKQMADQPNATTNKAKTLSLDGWAVAIALFLAALVRLGLLKHVVW
jgi:hypothetical protein